MVPISKGNLRSVPLRPLARLARGASIESVVENLAEIACEKGIDLHGIRVVRPGLDREFGAAEAATTAGQMSEMKIEVEGGQTQIVLQLREPADDAIKYEIEDALLLAAHRIELIAGRKLRVERAGKGIAEAPIIEGLLGNSTPMQRLRQTIVTAAGSNSTVLISGESGTGKEIAAQAIHRLGRRAKGPFIAVNCGALPESLLESELFGHERGAFTGADRLRKGRFELAHNGTLFLDEAGELTPPAQVKLLRALQERRFERVGGAQTVAVDVRVIAATNPISAAKSPSTDSATIFITGCTSSRSRRRRCANIPPTFRSSWIIFSTWLGSAWDFARRRRSGKTRSICSAATAGRATCASWRR